MHKLHEKSALVFLISDPNADFMVPVGTLTVVALDPPVPHVAVHWFVLMWWWVFHIASITV